MEIDTSTSDQKEYIALISVLEQGATNCQVLEIEILRSSAAPIPGVRTILQDGVCVGIPKQVLAMAYIQARKNYFSIVTDCNFVIDALKSYDQGRAILNCTAVMLLFDPEHVTAVNTRRLYLQKVGAAEAGPVDVQEFSKVLAHEFWLLDTLLTSHLHRHTKSPTLWSYRQWIYSEFCLGLINSWQHNQILLDDTRTELSYDLLLREFGVICRAGDRHPKNYYAWNYARKYINLIMELQRRTDEQDSVITKAIQLIHNWCLLRPNETSGWSFLWFLLMKRGRPCEIHEHVVYETIQTALSYAWSSECVWIFVKTALASNSALVEESRKALLADIETWIAKVSSMTESDLVIETVQVESQRKACTGAQMAVKWIKQYWQKPNTDHSELVASKGTIVKD